MVVFEYSLWLRKMNLTAIPTNSGLLGVPILSKWPIQGVLSEVFARKHTWVKEEGAGGGEGIKDKRYDHVNFSIHFDTK